MGKYRDVSGDYGRKRAGISMSDVTFSLYHGDCLSLMDNIPDKSVQAVICDLPYGTTENKWDSVLDLKRLWAQYERICSGAIILTASQPFTSILVMSNIGHFKHEWIWHKNAGSNFANTVREPMKEHESALVFSWGKWTYNKQMQERSESGKSRVKTPVRPTTTQSTNYRDFPDRAPVQCSELRVPSSVQKFNRERGLHPTQKPVALMKYLIRTYTNEGDVILDNCMGSGTTGVACIRTNRHFIGMELYPLPDKPIDKKDNPNYFFEAEARIVKEYWNTYGQLASVS